ncbi:hypothetical protein [Emticicia fontis]
MSNYKIAKSLKEGQLVNIITTLKNASNQNKEFFGTFVRFEAHGSNYTIIIKRKTDFTSVCNKAVYEELRVGGESIFKINKY